MNRLVKCAELFAKLAQRYALTEDIRNILFQVISTLVGRIQVSIRMDEKTFLMNTERQLRNMLGAGTIDAQKYRAMIMKILEDKSIDPVWKLKNISQPLYVVWGQLR